MPRVFSLDLWRVDLPGIHPAAAVVLTDERIVDQLESSRITRACLTALGTAFQIDLLD